jgi:uncharacterized protein (TIGR02145 family)
VPSDGEWTTLTTYLGGESVAGGKMKSIGTAYWFSPNTNATNESGFSAIPGGWRGDFGVFSYIGELCAIWCITENNNNNYPWSRFLYYGNYNVSSYTNIKYYGFSVRCLKN